jgi:polyhydroxyalkanoate synthesis repressor PhaR
VSDPAAGPRSIKRYANRKLYDTVARRFTSISEIEALVRSGIDVRVVDHGTGGDLTGETLAQVLGASVRAGRESVSSLLATLIRTPGRISQAIAADERQAAELRELRHRVEMITRTLAALRAEAEAGPPRPGDDPGGT